MVSPGKPSENRSILLDAFLDGVSEEVAYSRNGRTTYVRRN